MLWVLLLIGFVAGIFLIPAFCASRFKKLKQSNGIDEKEKDGSKEIEEEEEEEDKEEEEEEEMGIVKPKGIKLFTLEEFEDLIRVVHNEDGTVTSKLVGMITNENRDEPKSELAPVSFVRLSIFDNETRGTIAEDMRAVRSILDGSVEATALEGRGMGSMLGMAIADAMGHRFEFKPVYYGEPVLLDMGNGLGGVFKLAPGQWTDDTSMGLCIADSLLMCNGEWNPHDCMNRFIAWWYGGYDNAFRFDKALRSSCGLGGNIKMSLINYIRHPEPYTSAGDKNTSGNGSVMRACPVPILYHDDEEKAMDVSAKQSRVTHQGDEAAECSRLMAHIIVQGLNGASLRDVLDNLRNTFTTPLESVQKLACAEQEGEDPNRDWRWKTDGEYKFGPARGGNNSGYVGSYVMDALAMALHVLWTTTSFRDAVIKIVNLRGDSDSTGSVVGQIAGAFYGVSQIPKDWVSTVAEWDHYTIPLRGYMLVHKHFI